MAYTTHTRTRCFFKSNMESASKRTRTVPLDTERVLELLEEDTNSDDGMSSSEESDLDRELQNSSEESG